MASERQISVGGVKIGGGAPVVVQSMTLTKTHDVEADWAMIVPAGLWHNVVNTGDDELKLYSIYTPPEHPDGTVHRTKAEADAAEAEQHG